MTFQAALAGVFWFGLLTAVSPCPLATNIAAISFLSRQPGNPRRALLAAVLYTLGRATVYVGLGTALLWAFHAVAAGEGSLQEFASPVSRSLQRYGNIALGPVLLLIGMILLGWIEWNVSFGPNGAKLQNRAASHGTAWAFPLGALFALAFCPPSIALFFSALAISLQHDSALLSPLVYGIGTALPVIAFSLLIAFAGQYVGKAFHVMTKIERWLRLLTGAVFLAAGLHYTLTHIYGLRLPPF